MGKDDIETGEKAPLLNKEDEKAIEDLQDVGVPDAKFTGALQMSIRSVIGMVLIASIIWVPAVRKPFPNDIQARIPLVICLFVFTINPLLGTAINNGFAGILGTFWACLHMWVMNGIFPGGMKEGMSPTSATAIFGWVNFLLFTFVILFVKCGLGMKMFALATDIGFMLAFLDPKSTLKFSENFTIATDGVAVNTLLATCIACLIAPIVNLVPWPFTSAFLNMQGNAIAASANTAKLFESVIKYYGRTQYSVVIESERKHSRDLRAELDGLSAAIGSAWFERFDVGVAGTIRAMMELHCTLMNNIYDRLRALLVAVSTEDFGENHNKIMAVISKPSQDVSDAVTDLLATATKAATDGDISEEEKTDLRGKVKTTKDKVEALAVAFDKARKGGFTALEQSIFGESFFVLTVSAYARLTWEFAEKLIDEPPEGVGIGAGISAGISSTFSGLADAGNVNFTVKHFIALVICWLWSVYVDGFGGACVITAVFLMSGAVCPDMQLFLNVMNAVIVAVIIGTLVFQGACGTGYGDIVLPISATLIWTLGLYGYFAGGPLLLPCLVVVALTPFRWVTACPTGEIAAGARGLWIGMVGNIMAIVFVCSCQFFMAIDRASNLCITELKKAFTGEREAFDAFWAHKKIDGPMGPVAGHLSTGEGYNASAMIEPRMWRIDWKGALYADMVTQLRQIRLDIMMLREAVGGPDGEPDVIFDIFETGNSKKNWEEVQKDLNSTFAEAEALVIGLLAYEGGSAFTGVRDLGGKEGVDHLDALEPLIADMTKDGVKFPASLKKTEPKSGDKYVTMEDDELCQICTTFALLQHTIVHIAGVLQTAIRVS